mgnify:CR=1 FL=1
MESPHGQLGFEVTNSGEQSEGASYCDDEFETQPSSEQLLEEALFTMEEIRCGASKCSTIARWRAGIRERRVLSEKAAMARGLARWNVMQSSFLALTAGTTGCLRARELAAEQFRTAGLLQNTVHAWGPGRKLLVAEQVGQADCMLRKSVAAWRCGAVLARWHTSFTLRREKRQLTGRVHALFDRASLREALLKWRGASNHRLLLRTALARLARAARQGRLAAGFDALCRAAWGLPRAGALLRTRVQGAPCLAALAWHAKSTKSNETAASRSAAARQVARAWHACAAHWRGVRARALRHGRVWGAIRTHLAAKQLLWQWREVRAGGARAEEALESLFAFHNCDLLALDALRARTLAAWRAAAAADSAAAQAAVEAFAASHAGRAMLRAWARSSVSRRAACARKAAMAAPRGPAKLLVRHLCDWALRAAWDIWVDETEQRAPVLEEARRLGADSRRRACRARAARFLGKWRMRRRQALATEWASLGRRKELGSVLVQWARALLPAEQLLVQEWHTAEAMHARSALRRAVEGLHQAFWIEQQRCEAAGASWGRRCAVDALRLWRAVVAALAEMRQDRVQEEARFAQARAVWARKAGPRVLRRWRTRARAGRAEHFRAGLEEVRAEWRAWRALSEWRATAAWRASPGILDSFRCPERLARFQELRARAARRRALSVAEMLAAWATQAWATREARGEAERREESRLAAELASQERLLAQQAEQLARERALLQESRASHEREEAEVQRAVERLEAEVRETERARREVELAADDNFAQHASRCAAVEVDGLKAGLAPAATVGSAVDRSLGPWVASGYEECEECESVDGEDAAGASQDSEEEELLVVETVRAGARRGGSNDFVAAGADEGTAHMSMSNSLSSSVVDGSQLWEEPRSLLKLMPEPCPELTSPNKAILAADVDSVRPTRGRRARAAAEKAAREAASAAAPCEQGWLQVRRLEPRRSGCSRAAEGPAEEKEETLPLEERDRASAELGAIASPEELRGQRLALWAGLDYGQRARMYSMRQEQLLGAELAALPAADPGHPQATKTRAVPVLAPLAVAEVVRTPRLNLVLEGGGVSGRSLASAPAGSAGKHSQASTVEKGARGDGARNGAGALDQDGEASPRAVAGGRSKVRRSLRDGLAPAGSEGGVEAAEAPPSPGGLDESVRSLLCRRLERLRADRSECS